MWTCRLGEAKNCWAIPKACLQHIVGGWQVAGLGSTRTFVLDSADEYLSHRQPDRNLRLQVSDPGLPERRPAIPAICGGTATFRPTRSTASMRTANRTASMGVPANYKPAAAPLIPWGQTALPPNAPAGTDRLFVLGHEQRLDPAEQRHGAARDVQRQPASVEKPVYERPLAVVPGCIRVQSSGASRSE